MLAVLRVASTPLVEALSTKSVPTVRFDRFRPAAVKVTPVMLSVEVLFSLKTSLSVSPFKRLTPLNEASCAVVVIWLRMLLNCDTRPARVDEEVASATGPAAVVKVRADVIVPPIAPPLVPPRVEEA